MPKKTCKGCGKEKALTAFYRETNGKYGRRSRCIPCYATYTDRLKHENLATYRERARLSAARWRRDHPTQARERGCETQKRRIAELSRQVRASLGDCCARCPVADPRVLHIDHKNDDGAIQRKAFASRESFLNFVLAKPGEFQLLCPNCNHRKRLATLSGPGTRQSAYSIKYVAKLRLAALECLGPRCPCGQTDCDVLCIDHVNGGGLQDRKRLGGSGPMYRDVLVNPDKYQTLCHNCNWLKRHERGEWGAYLAAR